MICSSGCNGAWIRVLACQLACFDFGQVHAAYQLHPIPNPNPNPNPNPKIDPAPTTCLEVGQVQTLDQTRREHILVAARNLI